MPLLDNETGDFTPLLQECSAFEKHPAWTYHYADRSKNSLKYVTNSHGQLIYGSPRLILGSSFPLIRTSGPVYEQLFVISSKGKFIPSATFGNIYLRDQIEDITYAVGVHHKFGNPIGRSSDSLCYALALYSEGIVQSEGLSHIGAFRKWENIPNVIGHQRKPPTPWQQFCSIISRKKINTVVPIRIPYVDGAFQKPIRRR